MHLSRKKIKAIESGKAHELLDFETTDDVTLIRIANLSTAHNLELFTEESATAGVNSHVIEKGEAEKPPHYIHLPYNGGTIYAAGVGGEVEVEVIGVNASLTNIAVG